MCHNSPTASLSSASICSFSLLFVFFHIYKYDKGKCMIQLKRDPFRWTIMWFFLLATALLVVCTYIQVFVKYAEYYLYIPHVGVLPKPWQLWSNAHFHLFRSSYFILAVAWVFLIGIHLEEVLFWSYLINTIKAQRAQLWTQSIYFKLWIFGMIASIAIMFTLVGLNVNDLSQLENHVFLAGSTLSMFAVIFSMYIVIVFPSFIRESRRQGANIDVIEKLAYFKHWNVMRALFRFTYSACFLTSAVDGLTKGAKVNHSSFWMDFLSSMGMLSVFLSTILSLLILLPRNMRGEAGMRTQNRVFVQHAFPTSNKKASRIHSNGVKRTNSTTGGPWLILGDRLHLEEEDVDDLVVAQQGRASTFEMPFARGTGRMGSGEDLIHHLTPGDQESISTRSSPSARKEAINHSHLQIVVNPSHAEK